MRCSVLLNFKQIPVICPFCICLFFSFASNAVLLFTIRRSSDFSFDLTNSCSVCGMKDWLKHRHYYKKCDVLVLHFLMLKKWNMLFLCTLLCSAQLRSSPAEQKRHRQQTEGRMEEGCVCDSQVWLRPLHLAATALHEQGTAFFREGWRGEGVCKESGWGSPFNCNHSGSTAGIYMPCVQLECWGQGTVGYCS